MKISLSRIGEPQTRQQANRAKRINLIALSLLFLLLGLVFYAFWELRESKKELEKQRVELEEQASRLEVMAEELALFRERDWEDAREKKKALDGVREAIEKGDMEEVGQILGPVNAEPVTAGRGERKPDVAVFNTLADQKYQSNLALAIERIGYGAIFHNENGRTYSWLEKEPTIFYFDPAHKSDGSVLKQLLDKITGFSFRLLSGKDLSSQKAATGNRIEIHIVDPGGIQTDAH